jgi:hypothetical protein
MPTAERKRELELGPIAPWHAIITVWATETNHGRQTSLPHDWLFEVVAEWVGPPAVGMPRSLIPVSARDCYVVTTLDEARAIAHAAAAAFGKGGDYPPDLRELATGKPAAEQSRAPRVSDA